MIPSASVTEKGYGAVRATSGGRGSTVVLHGPPVAVRGLTHPHAWLTPNAKRAYTLLMARRSSTATQRRPGKGVAKVTGRPTSLTENTRDTLIGHLIGGMSIEASCALTGVHPATFYRWMERGEIARENLDAEGSIPDEEERFREFREAVLDARAQAEGKAVDIVMRAMHGGYVTSEEPIVDINGDVQYDSNTGEVLMKRTYTPPDGRLALAYLQRARPKDWSMAGANLNVKHEVSGPGGGPIEVTHEHRQVASLAERLLEVREQFQQEERELGEDGDIVDADVVEEASD